MASTEEQNALKLRYLRDRAREVVKNLRNDCAALSKYYALLSSADRVFFSSFLFALEIPFMLRALFPKILH